jgi:hypothetical protein
MDTNIMLTCIIVLLLISVGLNIFNTYKLEKLNDNPLKPSGLRSNSLQPTPFYKNTQTYHPDNMMGMEELSFMDISSPVNGMIRPHQTNRNQLQGSIPDMDISSPVNDMIRPHQTNRNQLSETQTDMDHSRDVQPFRQDPSEMYRRFNSR